MGEGLRVVCAASAEADAAGLKAALAAEAERDALIFFVTDGLLDDPRRNEIAQRALAAQAEGKLIVVAAPDVEVPLGFRDLVAYRWTLGGDITPILGALRNIPETPPAAAVRKRSRLPWGWLALALAVLLILFATFAANQLLTGTADLRAEIDDLAEQGSLTPEQAIELASSLENSVLQPAAGLTEPSEVARELYRAHAPALLQHPSAEVREALLRAASDRSAALSALSVYSMNHPEDPRLVDVLLMRSVLGAVGSDPETIPALEAAISLAPSDAAPWRLLAERYGATGRDVEASAALSVARLLDEAGEFTPETARQLQQTLQPLESARLRAAGRSLAGQWAVARSEFQVAAAEFAAALSLRRTAPEDAATTRGLWLDAQQRAMALDATGQPREACESLARAQQEVGAPVEDGELRERCYRLFGISLRERVARGAEAELEIQRQLQVIDDAVASAREELAAVEGAVNDVSAEQQRATLWLGALSAFMLLQLVLLILANRRRSDRAPTKPTAGAPHRHPVGNGKLVFASYSRSDQEQVDSIVQELERGGIDLWVDRENIGGGTTWPEEIVRAIRDARGIVLFCSPHSFQSDHVLRELSVAAAYGKPMLPVQLAPASPPDGFMYYLSTRQIIDLSKDPQWRDKLFDALKGVSA